VSGAVRTCPPLLLGLALSSLARSVRSPNNFDASRDAHAVPRFQSPGYALMLSVAVTYYIDVPFHFSLTVATWLQPKILNH